jgi:hypothetical protein
MSGCLTAAVEFRCPTRVFNYLPRGGAEWLMGDSTHCAMGLSGVEAESDAPIEWSAPMWA